MVHGAPSAGAMQKHQIVKKIKTTLFCAGVLEKGPVFSIFHINQSAICSTQSIN
jgi:hypothetical protein